LEMYERTTKSEIKIASIGVALSTFRNFKLVQVGRNLWS